MIKEARSKWVKNSLPWLPEEPKTLLRKSKEKQSLETFWKDKAEMLKEHSTYLSFCLNPKAFPVAPIALRKPQILLDMEIKKLEKEHLLFSVNEFSVFCVKGEKIPNLLHEIGRLREITFRQVGEGTNKSIDLDEFDQYYQQLFIWDNKARCLVGGYRIGLGREIMRKYGRRGFYTTTLFAMNPHVDNLLEKSMEMGRSFIVSDYQRKPLSLMLLWKGILCYLLSNPEYRYLVGPVSISNEFSPQAQQLMVELVQRQHNHYVFSQYIRATAPFQGPLSNAESKEILKNIADLSELDNYIRRSENKRMPVLLKKYMQLGAKIACFNVDPMFNNTLDGFLILDLMAVPRDILESLSKDLNIKDMRSRFGS